MNETEKKKINKTPKPKKLTYTLQTNMYRFAYGQ